MLRVFVHFLSVTTVPLAVLQTYERFEESSERTSLARHAFRTINRSADLLDPLEVFIDDVFLK